jgi:hypothetical protein
MTRRQESKANAEVLIAEAVDLAPSAATNDQRPRPTRYWQQWIYDEHDRAAARLSSFVGQI